MLGLVSDWPFFRILEFYVLSFAGTGNYQNELSCWYIASISVLQIEPPWCRSSTCGYHSHWFWEVRSVCIVLLVLVPCVFWSAYTLEMLSKEGEKQFSIFNHCIVCPIITRERVESGKSFLLIFWPVNVTCSWLKKCLNDKCYYFWMRFCFNFSKYLLSGTTTKVSCNLLIVTFG